MQEIRRAAELDSRAVRAEELRLRDLAVSLEARAEEVRRREREGARGREDLLQSARHEARQSLEVKEEGVARERCGGRGGGRREGGGVGGFFLSFENIPVNVAVSVDLVSQCSGLFVRVRVFGAVGGWVGGWVQQ